jgi:hypothetical protein
MSEVVQPTGSAKTRVLIALPWYKSVSPVTAFSVMGLIDRTRTGILLHHGDAFVIHTRNKVGDYFLRSGLEWMLTIDDDMVVPFGNAKWFNQYTGFDFPDQFAGAHALNRLLSHGKTLVGAAYWGRHRNGKAMYCEGMNDPAEAAAVRRMVPHDSIKPTRWVGTGCMLIHRSVFLDIEKKCPDLARGADGNGGQWFTPAQHTALDTITRARAALRPGKGGLTVEQAYNALTILEGGAAQNRNGAKLGMGEDVTFCIRAAEAGHQPYVDLGLVCGHGGQIFYGPKNTTG